MGLYVMDSQSQAMLNVPEVKAKGVTSIPKDCLTDYIEKQQHLDEQFFVLDLGVVQSLMEDWTRALPMARPFYAVKCNPEPSLLAALAALGSSFDCASLVEIESVLAIGVTPDRIVYANPCKAESHIKYAASVGVNLTTFDSKYELEKIQKWHPKCELLLRVKAPDSGARSPFGLKYGALPEEIEPLLQAAQASKLSVVGVSFHIGSGDAHPGAYKGAIEASKSIFETAFRLGMPRMRILDIGGGFTAGEQFKEASSVVKSALEANFPNKPSGLVVMGEPGRFFAESAFTLATKIIGKRVRGELREYWINEGVYGSLSCILIDHATVTCTPLRPCVSDRADPICKDSRTYRSTVFGPTLDGLDTVLTNHQLPELQMNNWLVFPNMGAYAAAAGSKFNGFNTSATLTHLVYSNPSC